MSDVLQVGGEVLIAEKAITKSGTLTGAWFPVSKGNSFHFAFYMESAGAADVTIYIDYWFWRDNDAPDNLGDVAEFDYNYDNTARDNWLTATVKANETTKDAWQRYDCPDELKYPFAAMRAYLVENTGAAVTKCSLIMCYNRV